jgi:type II secretory pathway component PulF
MTDRRDLALDLLVYTRSFATLVGAGVSLTNVLTILEEVSDEPLASATARIHKGVLEHGEPPDVRPVSAWMRDRPDLFTWLYVQVVRVGEIGGVLDEALSRVADLMESDWALWDPGRAHFCSLLVPPADETPFAERPPDERLRLLSLYCYSLAMMRVAGVPFTEITHGRISALGVAAEVFPPGPERDALARIAEPTGGRALSASLTLPFIPPFVTRLVAVGERSNLLDEMLDKAAVLLEYQRRHHLLKRAE